MNQFDKLISTIERLADMKSSPPEMPAKPADAYDDGLRDGVIVCAYMLRRLLRDVK